MTHAEMMERYAMKAVEMGMEYGPKLLLAAVVLLVGLRLISGVVRMLDRNFEKRQLDPTLRPFISTLVHWGLKAMLFISVASMVGIETTSLVAVLGAGGLAIGLALQGTLANFAGGVLILVFKPFKVGDLVEAQGYLGHVETITAFVTKLVTLDNKQVIIPNGSISNGNITNLSAKGHLRVDLVIRVSYGSDIQVAREALVKAMTDNPKVLREPAPYVTVLELADSSIDHAVRSHCRVEDYWAVYFANLENGKKALDAAGIRIPFPQRTVHMTQPLNA